MHKRVVLSGFLGFFYSLCLTIYLNRLFKKSKLNFFNKQTRSSLNKLDRGPLYVNLTYFHS